MPLGTEKGLGPGDIVLDWAQPPPPIKRAQQPLTFRPVYCGQTAGWTKVPLGTEVDLGPGHIVLDGNTAPKEMGTAPQFSAHVYCGQTAKWIKMPLGREVGLGSSDVVLDGTELPPQKRGMTPNFRPMSIVAKRLDASRCHLVRR